MTKVLENKAGRKGVVLAATLLVGCAVFSSSAKAGCSHKPGQQSPTQAPFLPHLGQQGAVQSGQNAASPNATIPTIVGLWHVLLVSGGQPFDEGFDQWHSDGTEILVDNAPPQPANGAGTVCIGVYKRTGPMTFKLRHPFWTIDANGNLSGSGVVLQEVTLDDGGNTYHGTFIYDVFDLSGNLIFEATGDLSATRITAD